MGQHEYDDIDGANCWFDCYTDLAFHTTEGYRLILETENYMISLGADGVIKTHKDNFRLYENEWLKETVHIWEDETENGIERDIIIDFENTLFVGQRLLSIEECKEHFILKFGDFSLKLFVYELGKMDKSFPRGDPWSYHRVLGFDSFLKKKCPLCGGDGEILLDFVSDYVVRCKQCKNSSYAEMMIRNAIENWNKGEVQCDLSDIVIE